MRYRPIIQRLSLVPAVLMLACSAMPTMAAETIYRKLSYDITIDATQDWYKNDPEYPGDQHSKGWAKHRYTLTTWLRSDGELQVRNLLDPDVEKRLEAKVIRLARQALKMADAQGQPIKIPQTEAERTAFTMKMNKRLMDCKAEPTCYNDTMTQYAAIMAAIDYPGALEEDTVEGQYLYFEPYKGCPETSRVKMEMEVGGIRYNKTVDKFVPFKEVRQADTLDASDGLRLCAHFLAVIDTKADSKPMYQETIFIPRPEGYSDYTESRKTQRTEGPQPIITEVTDWIGIELKRNEPSGEMNVELPLILPLNSNATWLGKFKGTAKVNIKWSFEEAEPGPPDPAP